MKKVLIAAVIFLGLGAGKAMAYTNVIESVRSTATVRSVACSTSTYTQLDALATTWMAGYQRAWARVQNQDSTANVYIGFDVDVSTFSSSGKQGEKIEPGGNAPYNIGRQIPIYCKSDGSSSTYVTISQFGFQ